MQTAVQPEQTASVAQLIAEAAAALEATGVPTARLDAEVLLAAACGLDRAGLYARCRDAVPPECRAAFAATLTRRLAREPLQYIIGRQEFWSLDFIVTPDVLVPRPETELLVELVLALAYGSPLPQGEGQGEGKNGTTPRASSGRGARPGTPTICEIGTGSGCIAVALARELPQAQIFATDISPSALTVAQANARRHGVDGRIRFVASDLFTGLGPVRFDVIVCNPPYARSDELPQLQPELSWEPRRALDAGRDGLDVIRRVISEAPGHLRAGGSFLMEIGAEQGPAAEALARAAAFGSVSTRCDYAGLPRVLVAR